jgi:hypothetical protein
MNVAAIYGEYKGGSDTKEFLTKLQSVKPKNVMDEILRGDIDNVVFEYTDSENSVASRKSSVVDDFINSENEASGDSDFLNEDDDELNIESKKSKDDEEFDFFGNKSDNEQFDEEEEVNSEFVKTVKSNKKRDNEANNEEPDLFMTSKKEKETEDNEDGPENYINASNDLNKLYKLYEI